MSTQTEAISAPQKNLGQGTRILTCSSPAILGQGAHTALTMHLSLVVTLQLFKPWLSFERKNNCDTLHDFYLDSAPLNLCPSWQCPSKYIWLFCTEQCESHSVSLIIQGPLNVLSWITFKHVYKNQMTFKPAIFVASVIPGICSNHNVFCPLGGDGRIWGGV